MPRTTTRGTFVRGRVARVTRTDNCGRPVLGEYSQAVSAGVITTTLTPNTTETPEISINNFAGQRCIYEPAVPQLTGYAMEINFCNVDFELFEIITKQTLVFDAAGKVVGLEVDTQIALDEEGFALETWTGAQGADVCDDPNAQGQWGYLLMPLLKGGIVGDITIADAEITFTITGASTREGNGWGNGPYAVELDDLGDPGVLYQAVSSTAALRLMLVTVAPPTEFTGARPLLDASAADFTSIAGIEGATPMEADFTTTPAAVAPTWWDFGDGEWDYVVAPGSASHIYEVSGTYTVRASQNGLVWTETTVTVPFP
jgi:hypothetical protein